METNDLIREIKRLKEEKNAVILAHNYQIPEIQDIADYLGDSLRLSQIASEVEADIIVFCGVHFMAESAKILSPEKKVLLPVLDAGCPMADMITAEDLKKYKQENPNVAIVTYVNSTAAVKAESDICCTSSNAVNVVNSLDANEIMMLPDRNLADYVEKQLPEKTIYKWPGFCPTHERVEPKDMVNARLAHKGMEILVHPECNPNVVKLADFVGSTKAILDYVKESDKKGFVIGTEMGILHTLRTENPKKKFKLLSACLICHNMKKTALTDLYACLKDESNEINVEESVREAAYAALSKMLEVK